ASVAAASEIPGSDNTTSSIFQPAPPGLNRQFVLSVFPPIAMPTITSERPERDDESLSDQAISVEVAGDGGASIPAKRSRATVRRRFLCRPVSSPQASAPILLSRNASASTAAMKSARGPRTAERAKCLAASSEVVVGWAKTLAEKARQRSRAAGER